MAAKRLTVKELAASVGYSEHWVRELARKSLIPAVKRGHIWLFDEFEVKKALINANNYPTRGQLSNARDTKSESAASDL